MFNPDSSKAAPAWKPEENNSVPSDRNRVISEKAALPIYDALVVATALEAGCTTFYSEDLKDGQLIDGQLDS